MSRLRQPNPIKILFRGGDLWLSAASVDRSEIERVHAWLTRVLEWRKQKPIRSRKRKVTP